VDRAWLPARLGGCVFRALDDVAGGGGFLFSAGF